MIGYLKGKIIAKEIKYIIIDVQGIGYIVHVTVNLQQKFNLEDEINLHIHTRVREDDISLYGFETKDDLSFFLSLINISGIGPKLAMDILINDPNKTKSAILQGNLAYLTAIPGIGKKTAERIILELKGKLEIQEITDLTIVDDEKMEDAFAALTTLGYQTHEIKKVLRRLPADCIKTEEIVTFFLQNA